MEERVLMCYEFCVMVYIGRLDRRECFDVL